VIKEEKTIRLICKNLERILKRFSFSEYRDSINLKDFLEHQKNSLTNLKLNYILLKYYLIKKLIVS